MTEILRDSYRRQINYLRLSVTDRCNLRCSYCMPSEGLPLFERSDLLTRAEIISIAETAIQLGIRKIRITGGEPLVRPDIVELLGDLGKLAGLEKLVLTTNGVRLADLATDLFAAGVHGTNISIDSLDPDLFSKITRGGDLNRCLQGIEASLSVGFKTKLNIVVMAGINDHEIADFVGFARTHPVAVRFIEYMPTQGRNHDKSLLIPSAQILEMIRRVMPLEADDKSQNNPLAGPARNYKVPGSQGTIGVISPVTDHFCADCNRIRITANGLARGCLFHDTGLDLKPALRSKDKTELAHVLRQVVDKKPDGHRLSDRVVGDLAPMSRMGG